MRVLVSWDIWDFGTTYLGRSTGQDHAEQIACCNYSCRNRDLPPRSRSFRLQVTRHRTGLRRDWIFDIGDQKMAETKDSYKRRYKHYDVNKLTQWTVMAEKERWIS